MVSTRDLNRGCRRNWEFGFLFQCACPVIYIGAMPIIKMERNLLTLATRSLPCRILFSLAVVAILAPVVYWSWGVYRADRIIQDRPTVDAYTQALKFDSSNPTLWWHRGRLRHYSVGSVDIPGAISDYRQALALNPRLGQAWVDLADSCERAGRNSEAEAALENAFATRRYSPIIRWQAGNFFLRRGNLAKMYESFKIACEYDKSKLRIATEMAWKADPDHREILGKLIPDNIESNLNYLEFLIGRDELELARPVWQRCLKNEIPANFIFKVSIGNDYIGRLLAKGRVEEALRVWDRSLAKAGAMQDSRFGAPPNLPENLVWNGSFENEMLRGGFDWRYPADSREMQFLIDLHNRVEGLKSLRITFGGANLSFSHLSQIVPIFEPGAYNLDYYVRTDGLTTDQTPYFSIHGYPEAACAEGRSGNLPGMTAWSKVSVPFIVKEGCKAVELTLRRDPSSKFDNRLKGSLWLDGVAIYQLNRQRLEGIRGKT